MIGMIGAGRIAQAAHLPALAKSVGARLVALCDPSLVVGPEVARRYGVPWYSTTEDLLVNPEVEAVIVAVPDRLHRPLVLQSLDASKHVLVEKPLAGTVPEAEELVEAAAESGLHLQVGAMKRHDPGMQYAAEAIRTKIGRVLSASVWYRVMSGLRPATEATLFPDLVVDERVKAHEAAFKADRPTYLLTTHGAHVFDDMRYLLGDPVSISARMASHDNDLTWHGLACLADGGLARFEITADVHSEWSEGAEVFGERGSIKLNTHFPFTLRASDVEVFDEATHTIERPVFADSNAYKRQIEAFARTVRDGLADDPDAADGLAAVRLIAAVAESVSCNGAEVKL
jgi:predicted dehydrogenase